MELEKFVEIFWTTIDNASLYNALQITCKNHKENKALLEDVLYIRKPSKSLGMKNLDNTIEAIYKETFEIVSYQERWRAFIKNYLKITEVSGN